MIKKSFVFLVFLSVCFGIVASEKEPENYSSNSIWSEPKLMQATKFDISMPLRLMAPKPIVAQAKRGGHLKDPGQVQTLNANGESFDVEISSAQTQLGPTPIPEPTISFQALTNIAGVSPPDPNGDVGLDYVVVMSNLSFQIYTKDGVSAFGPAANNTLWEGFGGDCENDNSGDPVVLFDQIANRWILSQFTSSGPEFFNCVAVSETSDPTGSYYRWAVSNGTKFPDYPKYGVWTDGYYISTRDFDGPYVSVGVYALKREDMVAGNPNPTIVYMFEDRTSNSWRVGDGLLPADIDGSILPPLGAPQYFLGTMDDGASYGAAEDALLLWQYDVDFDTPENSTFTLTDTLSIGPFDTIFPCSGGRSCIPQKDTSNEIDIQSYRQRPLHRLAYRNFGSHESLVANQSVEAAAGIGGVRWWEIRNPSTAPILHQEGTYAPGVNDNIHRWMGSIAMDGEGNIGLAYSASGDDLFPSIRYTGRLAGDPLGTMSLGEGSIVEGSGSQTSSERWGDYTSLTVDPIDDCTFWHVNQYYETSSGSGWVLRAGAFKFDECGTPGFYLRADSPEQNICVGSDVNYNITVGSISGFDSPVTMSDMSVPVPASSSFDVNPVSGLPSSTMYNITNTASLLNGSYSIDVFGSAAGADDKSITLGLNVYEAVPDMPILTIPADNATNIDLMPSLNWTGDNTIEYTIELATDIDFNNIIYTGNTTGNTIVPTVVLATNTHYYWRVRANNTCGDGNYSATFTFRTVPAPGDCKDGVLSVSNYSTGFENGLSGWTTDGLIGNNVWSISTQSVNSGTNSVMAVDVSSTSDQVLTSPAILLPTNQAPLTLQFWNQQSLEDRFEGCYDGGILEVSTDNGQTFNQIPNSKMLTDPYDGAFSSGNPLSGQNAWCGDPQDWLNSIVDLEDYAGETVNFRFRLTTDGSVSRDGWFIDDVRVKSCVLLEDDIIYKDGFEQQPN